MQLETLSWLAITQLIQLQFPQVPTLTPDELAAWLEQPQPPLLLDARQPEEYQVSHLRNAQLLPSDLTQLEDSSQPMVVYCSVGYRSAKAVAALQARGLNAFNLKGSIFAWANVGYPVYRDTDRDTDTEAVPVPEVHPYSPLWGKLLRADLHAYSPSDAR